MSDLSENFSRHEFACKCGCGFDTVDAELVMVVQGVRDYFGAAVTINCGCRCPMHNAEVGGADHSQHMLGRAADIVVAGFSPEEVHDYLVNTYPNRFGVGSYRTFTHIDTRTNGPARWDFR
jgi:uncharacterized protein YcbK (DUF882 family)